MPLRLYGKLTGLLLLLGAAACLITIPAYATFASDVNIQADQQIFDSAKAQTLFKGRVRVIYKDVHITGSQALLEMDAAGSPQVANFLNRPHARKVSAGGKEDIVDANVIRVYINNNTLRAEGNVVSYVTSVAADPFTIRSDIQQYDNANKSVAASGGVVVNYQKSVTTSPKALMTIGADGKADKMIFLGGSHLKNTQGDVIADKITVVVASGNMIAEKNVITNGDVKDDEGKPTKVKILSDYQQYDKQSGTVLASGHAVIYYQDYIARGPKATFKLKDNTVDKIILTGRGEIQDERRTITADTIVITMRPKHFDAFGNVKTRFKADTTQSGATGAGKATSSSSSGPTPPKAPVNNAEDE